MRYRQIYLSPALRADNSLEPWHSCFLTKE